MVQAKMPFLLLYMYPDWSLTPFIVFCSDKNIINVIYFIFLILIFFFSTQKHFRVFFYKTITTWKSTLRH